MNGLSWEYQSLESLIPNCQGCMVADSIYKLYMAVKKATNDFEVAKKAVKVSHACSMARQSSNRPARPRTS